LVFRKVIADALAAHFQKNRNVDLKTSILYIDGNSKSKKTSLLEKTKFHLACTSSNFHFEKKPFIF